MTYQRRRQDDFALSSDSSSLGNPGVYDPANLNLDTMDPYHAVRMNNPDPGNAFMYQIPVPALGVGGTMRKPSSETQIENRAGGPAVISIGIVGIYPSPPRQLFLASSFTHLAPSDIAYTSPDALRARLQTLGLQGLSTTDLPLDNAELEVVTPPDHYAPPGTHPLRRFPSSHEVHPDDSISMYRRPGQTPVGRKGGTDVDPGEIPAIYGDNAYHPDVFSDDGGITMNTPRSMPYLDPTVVPASVNTRGTYGGPGMRAMRDKLLDEQAAQEAARAAEVAAQMGDAARLASALTKLESTEEQLRTLQATLIAERVARTQVERDASLYEHDVRDIKEELASAVRALRRARNEGRKSEDDRRAMLRAYETAQAKIHQYQLELSVREAVSRGREKGRQEAWDEAAKWLGVNPPLPIEPLRQIPDTVFGRTPMPSNEQLPQQYASQPPQQDTSGPTNGYGQTPPLQPHQHGMYQATRVHSTDDPMQHQQYQPGSGATQVTPEFGPPRQAHSHPHSMSQGAQNWPHPHTIAPSGRQPGIASAQSYGPTQSGIAHSQHTQPAAQTPGPSLQAPHPSYGSQAGNFVHGSASQPHTARTRSVPQQSVPLPQQLQSQSAASVVDRSRRHASQPPPAREEPHAADEYLDRVEHDRRVQEMLQGTRMKSVPTSQYPTTHGTEKVLPEPFEARTPGKATTHRPSVTGTAATGTGRSRRRQSLAEGMHPSMVMHSIPDGDRYPAFPGAQPHGGLTHVGQRGHSRNTSFGSVDPAAYALPASTAHSTHQTPQAFNRQQASTVHSTNKTPGSGGDARSRMADALRYGHGMDPPPGNLSQIEEEEGAGHGPPITPGDDREREYSESAIMRNVTETPRQPRRMPSMVPPKHQPRPIMPGMLSGKAASEYHASGPRPVTGHHHSQSVVGTGPRGDDPPFSHPLFVPPGMAPLAVGGGIEDIQGPRHSALGLEGIETQSGGANALGNGLIGGGYAGGTTHDAPERGGFGGFLNKMVKAPTITVQPPSTQSKSNIPSDETRPHPPRAITPSVPPPNPPTNRMTQAVDEIKDASYDPPLISRQTVTTTEIFQDASAAVLAPKSIKPHDVPLPRSRAPTVSTSGPAAHVAPHPASLAPTANVGLTAPKTVQKGVKQAHEVPLPHSRAPTVISSYDPPADHRSAATRPKTPRQVPLPKSRPATAATSDEAFNIPLPKSRSQAPTTYDGASPDLLSPQTDRTARSHRSTARSRPGTAAPTASVNPFGALPNVSVIDFALTNAMARPLPESRTTTMYGDPSVISPPERARSEMEENTKRNAKTATRRKPVPEQVPLPPSRAPTVRPRVSTYARTEGTIDEVTEEESGRENHVGRKRW